MIDLMFPIAFANYDPHAASGEKNPGGGMATKTLAVRQVLSQRYIVNLIQDFGDVQSDVLVIEPLTPRLLGLNLEEWVEKLHACDAKKILYCSEMEVSRWAPRTLRRVFEAVDVVTANTKYQKDLIWTLSEGQVQPHYLCDPIDESLFRPSAKKTCRVFSAGRIAKVKNSGFLIGVFRKLKTRFGELIETAYFGSAKLWGFGEPEDSRIQGQIESSVDFFLGGISRSQLAYLFGESLIYVSKSTHDVYSSTHVETLSAGCISVGGGHPFYRGRPGIAGLKSVNEFVDAVGSLLEKSPADLDKMGQESRDYVLKHCGFEAFLGQFQRVMQELV